MRRSSQKASIIYLGNATSDAPGICGTRQFPKPPIIMGKTIKKSIKNVGAAMTTL